MFSKNVKVPNHIQTTSLHKLLFTPRWCTRISICCTSTKSDSFINENFANVPQSINSQKRTHSLLQTSSSPYRMKRKDHPEQPNDSNKRPNQNEIYKEEEEEMKWTDISSLPIEMMIEIFRVTEGTALLRCSVVCKKWRNIIQQNDLFQSKCEEFWNAGSLILCTSSWKLSFCISIHYTSSHLASKLQWIGGNISFTFSFLFFLRNEHKIQDFMFRCGWWFHSKIYAIISMKSQMVFITQNSKLNSTHLIETQTNN